MTEETKPAQRPILQRVVSEGIAHIRKQRGPALEGPVCKYRTTHGRSCFIGGLIKDEYYNVDLERQKVTSEEVSDALIASGYNIDWDVYERLGTLQTELHDEVGADVSIGLDHPHYEAQWMIAFEKRAERWCTRNGFAFPVNPL